MIAPANARERLNRILEDSIEKRRQVVITHHSPEGWRSFKSRFVSGSASARLILVSAPAETEPSGARPPEPGDTVGATFRMGHRKCVFGTTLLPHRSSAVRAPRSGTVALRWPDQLQQLRRRVYQRAILPGDLIIPVRIYLTASADPGSGLNVQGCTPQLDPETACHGQLEDLSAGGMRVKVAGASGVTVGYTCRCVLVPRPGAPSLVADAVVRHRQATEGGRASVGFQFVGLEATAEGRRMLQKIARIVAHLQRARSVRRRRPDARSCR